MAENSLAFTINGNHHMDILPGVHGVFKQHVNNLLSGGIIHTVLSDYGSMLFQGVPAPFGEIWLSIYDIRHQASLAAEANVPSIEAMHLVKGNVSFSPEGFLHPLSMKQQSWQLIHLPYVANKVLLPAGTSLVTLDLHYNRQWLEKLAAYYPLMAVFLEKTDKGNASTLAPEAIPISPDISHFLTGFFNNRQNEIKQNLYLERHAVDWLATTLESPYLGEQQALEIRPEERKILIEVEEYIRQHLHEPLTVPQLAKMAMMNECKFNNCFKLIFERPVYRHILHLRLELAAKQVIEGRLTLEEIDWEAGYGSFSSFSKMFKSRYGHPPSFFRNRKLF